MHKDMNMKRITAAFAAVVLSAGVAGAAPLNQGFELGLNNWLTIGDVSATPSTNVTTFDGTDWTIIAFETSMAQLNSQGETVANIATTLGITYDALNMLNTNPSGGNLTNGSAIYQTFNGTAGQTISQYFNYVATDYIPYNDPAFAVIVNQDTGEAEIINVLASIHGLGIPVGTSGNSGWNEFSYTLGADAQYLLAFIATNDKDEVLNSVLFLDNQAGTCEPDCPPLVTTPEPASLSLLGLGALALLGLRRRRR